jgi:ABC-type multidrug transport system ATPase subunit
MTETLKAKNVIELKDLSFSFDSIQALKNINLTLAPGKIYGLIGADSAGKTTLLRLIAGLLEPQAGSLKVLGLNPAQDREILAKRLAYMPQKFGLYEDLTVQENMELYAGLRHIPKADWEKTFSRFLTITGLESFRGRLAGRLSGGMKQKLGLICSLMGIPELLLLDEPSVGVDPLSRRELFKLVRDSAAQGTTAIWSTAYLDEAFNFDYIVFLHEGKIIYQGVPTELSSDPADFEAKIIDRMGGYQKCTLEYELQTDLPQVPYPVEALDLVKRYGDFYAVKNNTFHIKPGEVFGLLGPNGAGKSTSFKMMCGLSKPTNGTAKIMGVDMLEDPALARSYLGYMAQKFSLYGDLSVGENLDFFASVYGLKGDRKKERIEAMLSQFNLRPFLNMNAGELPLGFKQRLSFAAAILHQPSVLFLDEPTSGVDPVSRDTFWQEIKILAAKGVTVLITTHFMDEAERCDRISLFYKGESIALGTPTQLKQQAGAKNMEDAFIKLIEKQGR